MDKPHKKLNVWKRSIEMVSKVYKITMNFSRNEQFGISIQMRKAAVSIASNIAEGTARQTNKEFIQFLCIARGSLSELDTQFEISKRLGYIKEKDTKELEDLALEIDKMISGLIKSLKIP